MLSASKNAGFWRICYPTAFNIGICNAVTLSFSSARRKELKEASTPPRPPLQGRMQTRDLGRPKSLLFFGRPGLRPLLLNRGSSPLKPSLPLTERSWGFGCIWCASVSEANKAKTWRTPKGQRLESHTKTLTERVFPRSQLHPLHIGRGLGRVDASFSSFLRAEEKDSSSALQMPILRAAG